MLSRDVAVSVAGVVVGLAVGFAADEYLHKRGAEGAAKAALMGTGSCLAKDDLVCAMSFAQAAIVNAPNAYSPYEAAGDVYVRMNYPTAAKEMYSMAISRLKSGGDDAMLVTKGIVSVGCLYVGTAQA